MRGCAAVNKAVVKHQPRKEHCRQRFPSFGVPRRDVKAEFQRGNQHPDGDQIQIDETVGIRIGVPVKSQPHNEAPDGAPQRQHGEKSAGQPPLFLLQRGKGKIEKGHQQIQLHGNGNIPQMPDPARGGVPVERKGQHTKQLFRVVPKVSCPGEDFVKDTVGVIQRRHFEKAGKIKTAEFAGAEFSVLAQGISAAEKPVADPVAG